MTKTHYVVIWTVTSARNRRLGCSPVLPPRACVDDTGALLSFATKPIANAFADQLRGYGLDAIVHGVSSADVAELLAFTDGEKAADAADRVAIVEAQALSAEDATSWAQELADRFLAKIAAKYEASIKGTGG